MKALKSNMVDFFWAGLLLVGVSYAAFTDWIHFEINGEGPRKRRP